MIEVINLPHQSKVFHQGITIGDAGCIVGWLGGGGESMPMYAVCIPASKEG